MRFNIKTGSGEAICPRCKWSTVIERRTGSTITYCSELGAHYGGTVPPDVVKCNSYVSLGENSEHDYEKIAWLLRSDKSGKIRGFEPPTKKKADD
jgi:hypothetical protein